MNMFLLTFCRSVIGIVFLLSSIGKLRDMTEFKFAVQRFRILPNWLVRPFAGLFVASEFMVVILIVVGGTLMQPGFVLAFLLLLTFSIALISVLARKIPTSCNCFGSRQKPVSLYDVTRNAVFILCASVGLQLYSNAYGDLITSNLLELGLSGLTALVFVLIVINLSEIVQVFK